MSGDSLYLVLPANTNGFPENKNNSYKVRLAERLKLDGTQWECALVDCFYSNNWYNITSGFITVYQTSNSGRYTTFRIPNGRYNTIESVIHKIKSSLRRQGYYKYFEIEYLDVQDRIRIAFRDEDHTIEFGEELAGVLGFTDQASYTRPCEETSFVLSNRAPDIHKGFTSLYVYCSLVQNRLVGDSSVRLLRVLPVRQNRKQPDVYEEVNQKHYVPVTTTDNDVVEINISRDDGTPVAFTGGKVIVTVHLRRVK